MSRKKALGSMALGLAGGFTLPVIASSPIKSLAGLKGNIHHSVCRWCYKMPLEQLCEAAKDIGITSIDLLEENDWPVAKKYDLTCAMPYGSALRIPTGFNDPQYHAPLLKDYTDSIPKLADFGYKTVICFSGNRNGLSDEKGIENCAIGIAPVMKVAEKYGVTLCMELLNSKRDHHDYQCDHTAWGAAVVDKVGSPNFKLLYDIYHMQIMEGDVITTSTQYKDYIAHFHTGGIPGRHEINDTQELYYPAVMRAIVSNGFKGFVAQEFVPSGSDPLASLREAVRICDV